jgi:uncharacterized protein YjdB/uncharacterized protein YkwD
VTGHIKKIIGGKSMFRRTYRKVMGIALSAALAVTSPSFSVLAQENMSIGDGSGTGKETGAGDGYMEGGKEVVGGGDEKSAFTEDAEAAAVSALKDTGYAADDASEDAENAGDGAVKETADTADDAGKEAADTSDDSGRDAVEDITDCGDDLADEDADSEGETGAEEHIPEEGVELLDKADPEDAPEEEVSYNTDISFPEGFEGYVDDEAVEAYEEEEVLLGSPVEGAVNLDISGTFYTLSAEKILGQINKIRYEACKEGIYYHAYGRNLTLDDYHPLEWSAALEHGTRIRAIEAAMIMAHSTLGGGSIYEHADEVQSGLWRGTGENLAWNNNHDSSGITYGINQFYNEKSLYIQTKTWSGATGHYVNLINPNYRYVGVGCCMMDNAPYGWNTVAMQLAIVSDDIVESGIVDTTKDNRSGKLTYSIPVRPGYFKSLKITGDASVPKGYQREYSASAGITVPNGYGGASGTYKVSEASKDTIGWSSGDEGIFTVEDGVVTGVMGGKATLSARVGSVSATKDITVTVSMEDILVSEQGSSDELVEMEIDRNEVKNKILVISYFPKDTTDAKKATFKSSNTGVVSVDTAGKLTFKKPGTATITVSAKSSNKDVGKDGTISKTFNVKVSAPVTAISLNKTAVTLNYTGKTPPTAALKVSFVPSDTEFEKTAVFTSSDESIAKVDQNGKVTAVSGGEAVITASAYGYTSECAVKVVAPLKSMSVSESAAKLYLPDKKGNIEVRLEPLYTSDKEVVFTSSDPGRLKFSGSDGGSKLTVTAENGIARAQIEGVSDSNADATIEVSAAGGKFKKSVQVIIAKPSESVSISLYGKELSAGEVIDMGVGSAIEPEAVVLPADAYDTTAEWTSSDPMVASVNSSGRIVALREGVAVITSTSYNAKEPVAASFKVRVSRQIVSLSLNRDEVELYTDETYALTAFVSPEGVTDAEGADLPISYKSSDPAVATVSAKGLITAVSEGEATITASVRAGTDSFDVLEDECRVVVRRPDPAYYEGDTPYPGDDVNGIWLARESYKELKYYTGKPVTQDEIRIYHGKRLLTAGIDYTVSYKNNVKPAYHTDPKPPQMIVKLKGQYSGSKTYLFSIDGAFMEKNLGLAKITVSPSKVLFDGSEPDVKLTVKLQGEEVPAEKYDWYVCENGAGEVTLLVYASEEGSLERYWGTARVRLKVTGDRSMKAVTFEGISDQIYSAGAAADGGIQLPDLKLLYNGESLNIGSDYKLTYKANTKAGTATVTATGLGRYSGTVKKTFKILPNDGTAAGYKLKVYAKPEARYTKGGVTPDIKIKDSDGLFLTPKIDYTVSVLKKSNLAPGVMTCVVTGKGNYKGYKSDEIKITVTGGDLSAAAMTVQDKAYTTKKNGWKSSVKLADVNGKALQAGKDYDKEVIYSYSGQTPDGCPAAGTVVYVTVLGKGFYEGSAITGSYRIYEKGIDKMKVVIDSSFYTGRPVEPGKDKIHIYASAADAKKGIEIGNAGDYYQILGYSNNIKAGTAKITLRGRGLLGGTKIYTFKILKMPYGG